MAKVKVDPVQSSVRRLFSSQSAPSGARASRSTISVNPTSVSPVRTDRNAVLAAAFTGAGEIAASFAETHASISRQKQLLAQKQAEMEAKEIEKENKAKARSDLLNIVDNTVTQARYSNADAIDFEPEIASAAVRANIFSYVAGPEGRFVDNDTLRLVMDQSSALIDEMTPKTTIKVDGGTITHIQELDGRVVVKHEELDDAQELINDFTRLQQTHPELANGIMANEELTDVQKEQQIETHLRLIREVAEEELMTSVRNARGQQRISEMPEPVRNAKARQAYFQSFLGQERVALGRLIEEDRMTEPGYFENLADEYAADMSEILVADKRADDLSVQYGVDVFNLVEAPTKRYVDARVSWLRSLDALNVKKQGAAASVADMTALNAQLELETSRFEGNLPLGTRFVMKNGQNLAFVPLYQKLVRKNAQRNPGFTTMALAIDSASSRFKDLASRIQAIPEDGSEEDRQKVQGVLRDFYFDVNSWANRDYLSSLDVKGFVSTWQLIKESGVFEQVEPDTVKALEEFYEQTKAIPAHTAIFEKLERGESVDDELMQIYRENVQQTVLGDN